MFLKNFVDELAIVDSEENKQRLVTEAICEEEVIDPSNAIVMDLFGDKRPTIERNIDPEFEKILISMDIPDEMPEGHKRDYITDIIDKSMGIEHETPIVAVPTTEAAGDTMEDKNKVLTMKPEDYKALKAIIDRYNRPGNEKTKTEDAKAMKTFISKTLTVIVKYKNDKISNSVQDSINALYNAFGDKNADADTKTSNTGDVNEWKLKLSKVRIP